MRTFPSEEATFILPGPIGDIEVLASPAANAIPVTAIICHPHPLHSGTMHNKVVSTLARAFAEMGVRTVRFNFRGVGKSAGEYAEGIGETDDVVALAAWVKACFPEDALWLAGFSFGSFVAARAATQLPVAQLVSIAPPVVRFNFVDLPPMACPWLIIQGDQDEIVSPDEVFAWAETVTPSPTVIRMAGVGHFFHGQLLALRDHLVQALRPQAL